MRLLLKLLTMIAMTIGFEWCSQRLGIENPAAGVLVIMGGVSFFLGPYLTGAGFFLKGGFYVDTATPGGIWKVFGVLQWVAAGLAMLYSWLHREA